MRKRSKAPTAREYVRRLADRHMRPQEPPPQTLALYDWLREHMVEFGLKVWSRSRTLARREANRRRWYLRPTHLKDIRRAGH